MSKEKISTPVVADRLSKVRYLNAFNSVRYKKKNTKLSESIKTLTRALKKDKDYRRSWSANIAMAFNDNLAQYKKKTGKKVLSRADIYIVANNAAEYFLQSLCNEIKYPKGR